MAITFISRDYGVNVSIVRITTTDPLGVASAVGYITAQTPNINTVNEGGFTWQTGDEVLVQGSDGNAFFMISPDFSSLLPNATFTQTFEGLTALAGGGQTGAPVLSNGINVFTTVATAGDSADLPANVLGKIITVVNTTVTSMNVFPSLGDTINALSANTALAVAGGATTQFIGATTTNWRSK